MGITEKLLAELAVLREEKADMQKQLAEKEAMIVWLGGECNGMDSALHAEFGIGKYVPTDWRKVAQEAIAEE